MGRTPLGMITELRINCARELLIARPIADMRGYPGNSYFARAFRRECGMAGELRAMSV